MPEIGAYEAKTHLPKLLEQVRKGERFIITKHGVPVAELIPVRKRSKEEIKAAIQGLRDFQKGHSLGGMTVRELMAAGRRY